MARFRHAFALAALLLPFLFACGSARLHILITDFNSKGVDGLRVYRVGTNGQLVDAGRIVFSSIVLTQDGLQMRYTQYGPDNTPWGPLMAPIELPKPGQIALEMTFANSGSPGYFRFASYNEFGTSRPTAKKLYGG